MESMSICLRTSLEACVVYDLFSVHQYNASDVMLSHYL